MLIAGLFLLWLLSALPVHAQSNTHFQQGIAAFKAGDLTLAVEYFKKAQAAGLDSSALHYNLGVAYYHLRNYPASRTHFEQLTQDPETAPLAHYNLGLLALKQGYRAQAEQHFQQAYASSQEPKLKALALQRLEEFSLTQQAAEYHWNGLISLSAGYDDNISQLPDEVSQAVGDAFADTLVAVSGYASGNRQHGWRVDGSFYHRAYSDNSDLSLSALQLASFYDQQQGGWWRSVGVSAEALAVDEEAFERRAGLILDMQYPLGSGRAQARFRYSRVDPGDLYQAYAGDVYSLRLECRQSWEQFIWKFGYEWELNEREDLATTNEFYSHSPTRHRTYIEANWQNGERWLFGLRLDYRDSAFADPHVLVTANTTETKKRRDQRATLAFRLDYELSPVWLIHGQVQYQNNQSDIDLYDYQHHEISIGVEHLLW